MLLDVVTFILVFIGTFVISYYLYLRRYKKKGAMGVDEIKYLVNKFNLKKSKLNYKRMLFNLAGIKALIIAFVATMLCMIPINKWVNLMIAFMVAFVVLMGLIYSLYEIYGRYLKRKEDK